MERKERRKSMMVVWGGVSRRNEKIGGSIYSNEAGSGFGKGLPSQDAVEEMAEGVEPELADCHMEGPFDERVQPTDLYFNPMSVFFCPLRTIHQEHLFSKPKNLNAFCNKRKS